MTDPKSEQHKKCAHPACVCEVDANTKYCSAYCKDARGTTEIACNCGHTACVEGQGVETVPGMGAVPR
jgi:hypothetical protein